MYLLIDWLHMFVHVYMLGGHMYVMTHMWESEDNFWKSILSSTMWAPGVGLKLLDVPAIDFPTGESSWLLLYNLPLSCDFGFYSRLILKMLTFHHANVNLTTVGLKALDLLLDSGESSHKCSLLSMVRVKVWTSQLWFLERFFFYVCILCASGLRLLLRCHPGPWFWMLLVWSSHFPIFSSSMASKICSNNSHSWYLFLYPPSKSFPDKACSITSWVFARCNMLSKPLSPQIDIFLIFLDEKHWRAERWPHPPGDIIRLWFHESLPKATSVKRQRDPSRDFEMV